MHIVPASRRWLRPGFGQAARLRQRTDAATQFDLHRRRAAMLWVGWFGFNAGMALNAGGLAASAFLPPILPRRPVGSPGPPWSGSPAANLRSWAPVRAWWWVGLHYAGVRLCHGDAGLADGRGRRHRLLPGLHDLNSRFRMTTARRFRCTRRGRHAGGHSHRHLCHAATGGVPGHLQPLGLLEGGSVLTAQVHRRRPSVGAWPSWPPIVILKVLDAVMGLRVSRTAEIEGLDH